MTTSQPTSPPDLADFITTDLLREQIAFACLEDTGPARLDITSASLLPADAVGHATLRARKPGALAGAALLNLIAEVYDPAITVKHVRRDGDSLAAGSDIAYLAGPLQSLMAMERVALNYLTFLSGIASLTARFVAACEGTRARIYDTRKTVPGLRALSKYAVVAGGGCNHRIGLYDAVLVKDNHLAFIDAGDWTARLSAAVASCKNRTPAPAFIEVEIDRIDDLPAVLAADVDIVLCDNMGPDLLRKAVAIRNELAPQTQLEASGGVNLDTVTAIARTGVDRIAIGALTHSAPTLDIGMDIDEA